MKRVSTPRYYDKLAKVLPEFAPETQTPRTGRFAKPMTPRTARTPTRGKLISLNTPREKIREPEPRKPGEEPITPRRISSPMSKSRHPIFVMPINIIKTQQPTIPGLSMPEAPRSVIEHKENIEKPHAIPIIDISKVTGTPRNEEEDIPELQTNMQPPKINNKTTSETDVETDVEIIRFASSCSSVQSDIDDDGGDVLPPQIQIGEIDTSGFPYIPPLAINFDDVLATLPESPPPSISPYTYTEEVVGLDETDFKQFVEEDTLFLKSITEGGRFTTDNVGQLFTAMNDFQYNTLSRIIMEQYYTLSQICESIYKYLTCQNVSDLTAMLEEDCEKWFNCRTAMVWIYIPSANTFVNHSRLMRYPADKGFIYTAASEKRRVISSSPISNPVFDEENDLPFCEDAELILVEPIVDPKSDKVYGVILMVDKVDDTGASFMYWPQSDLLLLSVLSGKLHKAFRRFSKEISTCSMLMKQMTRYVSRQYSFPKLVGYLLENIKNGVGSQYASLLAVTDGQWYHFDFTDRTLMVKHYKDEKLGIAKACLTGSVVNIVRTGDHPLFLKGIDGPYENISSLMRPVYYQNSIIAIIIARGKNFLPCFTIFDDEAMEQIGQAVSVPLLSSLKTRKELNELKSAVSAQNKLAALLQTAESLASTTDTDSLIERIIGSATNLVDADRGSLFIVDEARKFLMSKVAQGTGKLVIPINSGLAGTVATTGETINIPDVYQDPRFNSSVDKKTGYRTKSLMTVPVKSQTGELIAVAQVMNKKGDGAFSDRDVELTKAMLVFTGIALSNARVIESAQASTKNIDALLNTAGIIMEEGSLSVVIRYIMSTTRELVHADRCAMFMIENDSLASTVAEGESKAIVVSKGKGIVGFVAQKGYLLNIPDAYKDNRFNSAVDKATGYHTTSILAVPVRNSDGSVLGVVEMINKDQSMNGGVFTKDDELLTSGFCSFANIALEKHDDSNHIGITFANMMGSEDSYVTVPSLKLLASDETRQQAMSYRFDITQISEIESVKLCISIFAELGLTREFEIPNATLVDFFLAAHDILGEKCWYRAVDSMHLVYLILQTSIDSFFSYSERLALLISALLQKLGKPSESTSQRDIALEVVFSSASANEMIACENIINLLTTSETGILSRLSEAQMDAFWEMLMQCVLGTDMKKHFSLSLTMRGLLYPMKMVLASRHRTIVGQMIVKMSSVSFAVRRFQLFEKFAAEQLMSAIKAIGFMEFVVIPLAANLYEIEQSLKPLFDQAESNINLWLSKAK